MMEPPDWSRPGRSDTRMELSWASMSCPRY